MTAVIPAAGGPLRGLIPHESGLIYGQPGENLGRLFAWTDGGIPLGFTGGRAIGTRPNKHPGKERKQMSEIQIVYAEKLPGACHHAHITRLGSRTRWWTVPELVAAIRAGVDTFITFENGRKAMLRVVSNAAGQEYVQTFADGAWQNNLLSLPPSLGLLASHYSSR